MKKNKFKKQTPLYYASLRGYTEIVELLLENGADVNKGVLNGKIPLAEAAGNGECSSFILPLDKQIRTNVVRSV